MDKPKTYSVWVRFESVPAQDANEAIRQIASMLMFHIPLQFQDFKVLKELMRDFYPEVRL
jgi:tRNA A37 methylthiotransferase MiaB